MTRWRVVFSRAAADQAAVIADWWTEHRRAAPDLFLSELTSATRLLARAPRLGAVYARSPVPGVRRMLIGRSRYHVYWEVDDVARTVTITAVWHAERGAGPPL
jgi:plasmid stabilization system protein ParE